MAMPSKGRPISAYVNAQAAARTESISQLENRKIGQVAGEAVNFYTLLPSEARDAIRKVEALSGEEGLEKLARKMTRVLLDAEWQLAIDRIRQEAGVTTQTAMSEDDLLAAGVEAVRTTR